ncbi:fructuronate reductase [Promicromonospora umidemergens]|uniref:Mannitol-1-phosphate 5-dehydrogenase n=1 Tax=Promicromonospora umidemergens TaxID=629679 RepID=A0ABP8X3H6_9MICO|nr:mannitol dehydrogenase family protein [Promicromonospora umidemergens]MCP2285106.1 fructuronate reductase [Promicromonospora umidemergens]
MTDDRLHRDNVPVGIDAPVTPTAVGIVHLGIGAFHRAHQAVYTERAAIATGDTSWGILGVTQRSARVRDQLRPQGGVYAVLTAGEQESSVELIGSVVDVAYPAEETERVLAVLAAPSTHVVTLTITEKGYARKPDGSLDLEAVAGDLEALRADARGKTPARPASSAIGLLVRGLAARAASDIPITVLTCDNMVDNGRVLERLVRQAAEAGLPGTDGDALRGFLDTRVTFPCSMVDRIVPATTPEQRDHVSQVLGARDEGLVVGEPFAQWVIEDRFAGPRPAWEAAGATLTKDVAPFEQAKLRLLNGTHSLVAYSGWLAGHTTIAEAVADPAIAERARQYLFEDALPTLTPPDGLDLHLYGEQILARFANPHTGHTTAQVAMDGTQKIPFRWGGVLADALAAGREPQGVAFGLAAWAEFVRRRTRSGQGVDDPRAEELEGVVSAFEVPGGADGLGDVEGLAGTEEDVRALIGLPGLLPESTPESFLDAVAAEIGAVER